MDATPRLIALYSPDRQMGKSTITRLLTGGMGFENVKFADPLKDMTRTFLRQLGVPEALLEDYVEGHLKEVPLTEYGFEHLTSRRIMQTIGKEWGRDTIDRNLWTTLVARRVRAAIDAGSRIVIDDLRYPNEYDLVKQMGGECWCVYRPSSVVGKTDHPSEGLLDTFSFDCSLVNDGTVEELEQAVLARLTRF